MTTWLTLTDYSTKYKVSVSTLRRRIKAEDIRYRFDDGKYFISDEPVGTHQRAHRPSQDSEKALMSAPSVKSERMIDQRSEQWNGHSLHSKLEQPAKSQAPLSHTQISQLQNSNEPILTAANKLLNELKKAYSLILQEKEEQMLQLKGEVVDLKTLVRVLESENDRLKNFK